MMKTISIDVPDDVWAEVQRRAAQANSQASTIALTPEALASILVKVGLCFSNDPKPVVWRVVSHWILLWLASRSNALRH